MKNIIYRLYCFYLKERLFLGFIELAPVNVKNSPLVAMSLNLSLKKKLKVHFSQSYHLKLYQLNNVSKIFVET